MYSYTSTVDRRRTRTVPDATFKSKMAVEALDSVGASRQTMTCSLLMPIGGICRAAHMTARTGTESTVLLFFYPDYFFFPFFPLGLRVSYCTSPRSVVRVEIGSRCGLVVPASFQRLDAGGRRGPADAVAFLRPPSCQAAPHQETETDLSQLHPTMRGERKQAPMRAEAMGGSHDRFCPSSVGLLVGVISLRATLDRDAFRWMGHSSFCPGRSR